MKPKLITAIAPPAIAISGNLVLELVEVDIDTAMWVSCVVAPPVKSPSGVNLSVVVEVVLFGTSPPSCGASVSIALIISSSISVVIDT